MNAWECLQPAQPLVSVIMPAYNTEKYIAEAIRSVMAQTYTNWELLVIDDASTDHTVDMARSLARTDPRITVICNPQNIGAARTRNRGLDLARGDWVALLDSDDLWHERKLEQQIRLAKETAADIIYCSYALTDSHNNRISDFIVPQRTSYDRMLKVSVLSCSTVLLSRKVVAQYRFSEDYYHEDYAFWLRLLRNGLQAAGCREILAYYRLQNGSRSHNKLRAAKNRWMIYRKAEHLSLGKAIRVFTAYTYHGIMKHKRL